MKDYNEVEEELVNRKIKLRTEVGPHKKKIELYKCKGILPLILNTLELVKLNFLPE